MAPEQKKRKRPVPTSSQRSKKRQKIEAVATTKEPTDVRKLPVALDALPWNEVEMPEMLENTEGFYGLEEVEDIQVIRDGDRVQFLPIKMQKNREEDEEFQGFEDDENSVIEEKAQPEVATTDTPAKSNKDKKSRTKKQLDNPIEKSHISEALESNIFVTLGESTIQDEVDLSAWEELDLSSESLSALAKLGFTNPTPIQKISIPEILAGHDVIGKASTGSGKTLAFAIPILEKWLEMGCGGKASNHPKTNDPIALILSPTRELAHQLTEHIAALFTGFLEAPYIATVTGGLSVHKQQRQLLKADIIIGTPGRLWEVISSGLELSASLKNIQYLVIDEADRLLTEGHFKEVEEILNSLDRHAGGDEEDFVPSRQTLVFSATFHKGLQQKLAGKGKYSLTDKNESMEYLLKKLNFREERPKFIDVNPISQMAEGLREGMVECAGTEKDLYLYALLLYHPNQRVLIFTNSIHSVRRLTPLLQNLNLSVYALHSQMPQKARLRSIERFSSHNSPCSVLVATDVAARGLDISAVHLVIHYHLPRDASTYVHRSGRTARASASGSSILLCAAEEVVATRRLVVKVHAQNAVAAGIGGNGAPKSKYYIRSLDLDRRIVGRLKPRVTIAKQIADSMLAKEKKCHENDWVRSAAEELGVDYDSEEFEKVEAEAKGRGNGRRAKEREAQALSRGEITGLRAELKALLAQRINVGISERYLTAGGKGVVDVEELLTGLKGEFLGHVSSIGLDE